MFRRRRGSTKFYLTSARQVVKRILVILAIAIFLFSLNLSVLGLIPTAASQSAPQTNNPNLSAPSTLIHPDGVPIIIDGETVFLVKARTDEFSRAERAKIISDNIRDVAKDPEVRIADLSVRSANGDFFVAAGKTEIISITQADADALNTTRESLAQDHLQDIRIAVAKYRQDRSFKSLRYAVIYSAIATLIFVILLIIIGKLSEYLNRRLLVWEKDNTTTFKIQRLIVLSTDKINNTLIIIGRLSRVVVKLGLLYIYLTLVLSAFPWTRGIGNSLLDHVAVGLLFLGEKFLSYLPRLLIIIVIFTAAYYTIRLARYIFSALGQGTISIPGFYRDWADPTYRLTELLIGAIAIALAFPYLPGFDTPAFRSILLFVGAVGAFGAKEIVSNAIAGVVLIYTRAFQVGDRVEVGSSMGTIAEKTLLVTRIITPKNVVVTIPNSQLLNSDVSNYSTASQEQETPLVLHTGITLGYDVPWRLVHQVLVDAAKQTGNVLAEPEPFVLQTSLDDFYVAYEINIFTNQPSRMERIYSELHQHIQDKCNEAGIEILSPGYVAVRDGNQNTIPESYLPSGYSAPGFRVYPLNSVAKPAPSHDLPDSPDHPDGKTPSNQPEAKATESE
jgi:small-conductance mechanosensitive channel